MGNLLVAPITEKETHKGASDDDGIEYGVSSMQGWRVHMEDAHICETQLFALEPKQSFVPTKNESHSKVKQKSGKRDENDEIANRVGGTSATDTTKSDETCTTSDYKKIPLKGHSMFAVFDGHGGTFAAEYAGLNFTRVFARQPALVKYAHHLEHLADTTKTSISTAVSNLFSPYSKAQSDRQGLELLESALKDAFLDVDREIWRWINGKPCGTDCILPSKTVNEDENKKYSILDLEDSDSDLNNELHYHQKEDELWQSQKDAGTTATVVILTPTLILCANAGDSRAVFSRNGHSTIPLSYDHKPDDEAEERRIYEAGGFVRGSRVEGDLAVSRGLGDFRFKEDVIYEAMGLNTVSFASYGSENGRKRKGSVGAVMSPQDQKVSPMPDIIVQNRNADVDEFIAIACDGIFDVQTNHECISMIAEIFQDGERDLGLVCEEILDLCLDKGSKDNMTAVVIKLPAMVVGEGGGVFERRHKRMEKKKESEEEQEFT